MPFISNKKIPAKNDELNKPSISTLFKNTIEETKENEAPNLFKNNVSHNSYKQTVPINLNQNRN